MVVPGTVCPPGQPGPSPWRRSYLPAVAFTIARVCAAMFHKFYDLTMTGNDPAWRYEPRTGVQMPWQPAVVPLVAFGGAEFHQGGVDFRRRSSRVLDRASSPGDAGHPRAITRAPHRDEIC